MCTFERDGHTVILGDAVGQLRQIPDESVNLIFADPPYNIGKNFNGRRDSWESAESYIEWCGAWIDECVRTLRTDGSLYLMAATQHMPDLDIHVAKRLTILSRIVWHYDSAGVQAKRYFGSLYEPILFAVKDGLHYTFNGEDIAVVAKTGATRKLIDYRKPTPTIYNSTKVPGNVWYFPRVRYRMPEYEEHPSQKPTVLLERIIKASSRPGDLILDPFAGTFTTAVVAKKLHRRSLSIEIDEEYVKIGLRRLGIATHYRGALLTKPEKRYRRRNGGKHPQPQAALLAEE